MKTIARLLSTALLALTPGCAQTDWIDRTLVTVDVTGVRTGRAYIAQAVTGLIIDVRQELVQEFDVLVALPRIPAIMTRRTYMHK